MIARGIRLNAKGGGRNAPATGGDVVARAIQGSLNAPLNADQKRALAATARKAYDQHGGSQTGMTFEDWRHEQQHQACGKASLREATQNDFKLLRGHFDKLTGRAVDAFRQFLGQSGEGQRRELALAKLRHVCDEAAAVPLSEFANGTSALLYAEGFLRKQRGVTLDTAHPKQLWHAVFVMERKLKSLRAWADQVKAEGDDKVTGGRGDKMTGGQGDKVTRGQGDKVTVTLPSGHPVTASSPEGSGKTRQDSIPAGGAAARPVPRVLGHPPRRVNLRGHSGENLP